MRKINISKPNIGPEEISSVSKILKSGTLAQGQKVAEFEQAFIKFCATKHAIACNNGTMALIMALLATFNTNSFIKPLHWKDWPEIITTPFSFIATINSIVAVRAKPVFVDIDPRTFNIDAKLISKAITKKSIGIIPVHLYGLPCDMKEILEKAHDNGLGVIEDACQAHGADYWGKMIGSFGDAGCFSFYPTKNMTTGEGGMVTTNSASIAEKCQLLRNQGQSSGGNGPHKATYDYKMIGFNYRMTEIAAAMGIIQLRKLPKANNKRRVNAKLYDEGLSDIPSIEIPYVPKGYKHVFHQYGKGNP